MPNDILASIVKGIHLWFIAIISYNLEQVANRTRIIVFTHLVDNENELSSTQLEILGEISKKVNNIVSQVAGEHKDLHGALSKIGKSIDRVSEIMTCKIIEYFSM